LAAALSQRIWAACCGRSVIGGKRTARNGIATSAPHSSAARTRGRALPAAMAVDFVALPFSGVAAGTSTALWAAIDIPSRS
jgi:hypothetical protein